MEGEHSTKWYRVLIALAVVVVVLGLGVFALATFGLRGERAVLVKNALADLTATPAGDLDDDGLNNGDEDRYHTDFWDADTDDDGFTDGAEVKAGYNPTGPGRLGEVPSLTNLLPQ